MVHSLSIQKRMVMFALFVFVVAYQIPYIREIFVRFVTCPEMVIEIFLRIAPI